MKTLIEKSKTDICFIFFILLLNPVLWEIKNRIVPLFPDSVAYIVLSKIWMKRKLNIKCIPTQNGFWAPKIQLRHIPTLLNFVAGLIIITGCLN